MREAKTSVKSMLFARKGGLVALLPAALAALIYLLTLAPDVLPGDPGEFQFAAWRLGLAHPTGYPLYLLLGSAWQHAAALFGVSPAAALNALSALFAVLTVPVMVQLMEGAPLAGAFLRRTVALWTGLMLALNLTFWSQALVAEVYTLHALLLVLLLWALQAAIPPIGPRRLRPRRRSRLAPRRLMLIALILGLSFAHHAMTLLAIPAVLLYLWTIDRRWHRLPWATWGKILAVLLTPLLLYAYIPLRSGPQASPWLHQRLGDGTLTLYHNDWASFLNFITGRSISVGFYGLRQALGNAPRPRSCGRPISAGQGWR